MEMIISEEYLNRIRDKLRESRPDCPVCLHPIDFCCYFLTICELNDPSCSIMVHYDCYKSNEEKILSSFKCPDIYYRFNRKNKYNLIK